MILYGSTFIISAYRTGEKLLVKQEFNIDELTKARMFYQSIRFFKNHTTWYKNKSVHDGKTLDSLTTGSRYDNDKRQRNSASASFIGSG